MGQYGLQTVHHADRLVLVLRGSFLQFSVEKCGCNVPRHSGFVPLFMRLKLLRKAVVGEKGALQFSSVTGQL